MNTSSALGRAVLYVLIFFSGAAGLVYQVVWHKYLTILLGAQARATAVVLAIFLGGISAGYLTFGRWTRWKRWNLLFVYAVVEIGLAVWAFLFPQLFSLAFQFTPRLLVSLGVNSLFLDIAVSVLLIGFPTFLMGGTLPLLTQGLSEDLDEASGTHARIYGYNTVGACFGSLLAGYVLVPKTSLPVAVSIAGITNVLVALVTYFAFAKYTKANVPAPKPVAEKKRKPFQWNEALLLAVGFLSGFYVLTLETVLIRLVGLSTGSSQYNFTLIVSIFVFALGIGSLLVRRIGKSSASHLVLNQLGIAVALFFLYLSGNYWTYWVHLVRIVFRDVEPNFYLYQAALGFGFLVLLIIPIGLCGLTLPLCFHLLKDRKETLGHRVGQLYGLNTVGCVLGALLGGYVFLEFINLDQLFKFCVFLSLVSCGSAAAMFFRQHSPAQWKVSTGSAVFALVVVGVVFGPTYVKERYIQPFRQQHPMAISYDGIDAWTEWLATNTEYVYYKDGPNTSVGIGATIVNGKEVSRTVFVNGKSDGNTKGDFFTMNMTGHIPALLARKLDKACVIGLGTGITIGALAKYEEAKSIDVVEIADTLIDSRHFFDEYNGNVSTNPKVHVHAMDAFRFLGGAPEKFDVIISEPSNPWVAGVENLYTTEFYDIAKRKLHPEGLYVQWVQAYSFNEDLLKRVLRTLTGRFKYVAVFQMLEQDLALVASDVPLGREDLERSAARMANNPAVKDSLKKGGIDAFETVLALEIVPAVLAPVLGEEAEPLHIHSPRLSHEAAKAFFLSSKADVHTLRREYKEFFPAVASSLLSIYLGNKPPSAEMVDRMRLSFCEARPSKNRWLCEETLLMAKWQRPSVPLESIYEGVLDRSDWRGLAAFRPASVPKGFTARDLDFVRGAFNYYKRFYSPISRIPSEPILRDLDFCLKIVPVTEELRGDCLLQRAAVLEVLHPEQPEFITAIREYGEWFANLSPGTPSYQRFKRAFDILDKVVTEIARGKLRG